jgi:hypothetical protein
MQIPRTTQRTWLHREAAILPNNANELLVYHQAPPRVVTNRSARTKVRREGREERYHQPHNN